MADDFEVKSFVPQAIKGVAEGTDKAMLETAVRVTTQAKLLSPVDLGQLRNSLMWKSNRQSGGNAGGPTLQESVKGDEIIVGTAVGYGIYQEFGTRKMAAQPFFRPAIDIIVNGAGFVSAMAKAMQDSVKKRMPR